MNDPKDQAEQEAIEQISQRVNNVACDDNEETEEQDEDE